MKKIHEIYYCDKTTQYDPNNGKDGFFADYINRGKSISCELCRVAKRI